MSVRHSAGEIPDVKSSVRRQPISTGDANVPRETESESRIRASERATRPSEDAEETSMLRLRDIMTTDLVTLDANVTIREAMDVFGTKRISGAPVMAGDEVIGVISAGDLLQFAAALPGVPTERELAPDLLEDVGEDIEAAARAYRNGDDPAGVYFTDLWDDAGASVVSRMAMPAMSEWNSLEEHTVSEAMTHAPVHALPPATLVRVAADYIRNAKIHRVLVMTGRKLIGVVTTSDITRAVADGGLFR
jgi:CBS domain-containing protein